MNVRKFFRYQLRYYRNEIAVFYLAVIGIYTLVTAGVGIVTMAVNMGNEVHTFSGMETMTLLFMFVCSAAAYKYHLHMGMQNGISRKSMFISNMMISTSIAAIMCVSDKIITTVFGAISAKIGIDGFSSLYSMIYGNSVSQNAVLVFLHNLAFSFLIYMLFSVLGNFITGLYCRMNLAGIISVSITVPAALFILLPVLDYLTGHVILSALLKFVMLAFGMGPVAGTIWTVINPLITLAVLTGIFTIALWLVIRRASVKK